MLAGPPLGLLGPRPSTAALSADAAASAAGVAPCLNIAAESMGSAAQGWGRRDCTRPAALTPFRRVVKTSQFGEAGAAIQEELDVAGLSVPCERAGGLEAAVKLACRMACAGDAVLLSPACASFDEFDNFEHRGRVFASLAKQQR